MSEIETPETLRRLIKAREGKYGSASNVAELKARLAALEANSEENR